MTRSKGVWWVLRMINTVLIIDGTATNRIVLKVRLSAAGYRTLTAADAATGLALARAEQPDLMLLDYDLPAQGGEAPGGLALLAALRADPDGARSLVVMMSARDDAPARLAALRAGADDHFSKQVNEQTLLARLRSLTRAQENGGFGAALGAGLEAPGFAEAGQGFDHPGLIALVTARPEDAQRLARALAPFSPGLLTVLPQDQIFDPPAPGRPAPDVYLIDAGLGDDGGGLKVMSALLSRQDTRHAKVCILHSGADAGLPAMAFDLGAADLVARSQSAEEIALRLNRLARRKADEDRQRASVQDNLRLAMIDPLTEIPNRRSGLSQLAGIAERALASGQGFALMVLDLDRFKSVNDRFGHSAGDAVLVEVVRRLSLCLRASDLIARIGGEEFLIALPGTGLAESRLVAERLCQEIEARPVELGEDLKLRVTISIGLALGFGESGQSPAALVNAVFGAADRALLDAKGAGRNQVTISRSAA